MKQQEEEGMIEIPLKTGQQSPNSRLQLQEQYPPPHPSTYLQFPHPFLDDDELFLRYMLSQQQLFQTHTNNNTNFKTGISPIDRHHHHQEIITPAIDENLKETMKSATSTGSKKRAITSKKRSERKDRHSKIYTAQGPRDRRMRLSLQIARKFFDLQDMLGFDKASKTIEWLFAMSKSAIKELKESFSSHGDGGNGNYINSSEMRGVVVNREEHKGSIANSDDEDMLATACRERVTTSKKSVRVVRRESREKARARARERTREKLLIRDVQNTSKLPTTSNDPHKGRNCGNPEELSNGQRVLDQHHRSDHHHDRSMRMGDELMFNYSNNVELFRVVNSDQQNGFQVNWEINNPVVQGFCSCTMRDSNSSPGQKVLGLDEIHTMIFHPDQQRHHHKATIRQQDAL